MKPNPTPEGESFEELYSSCGAKGKDAAMECHRLRCKECGGFQEGCNCDEYNARDRVGDDGTDEADRAE